MLQVGVVEAGQDVTDAETLRNTLGLFELFLVACDVVILGDVLDWSK